MIFVAIALGIGIALCAPMVLIDLALRRYRRMPPATAREIRRSDRKRRLRLGLR